RRHTRFSRDSSSDVCSSDLAAMMRWIPLHPTPCLLATLSTCCLAVASDELDQIGTMKKLSLAELMEIEVTSVSKTPESSKNAAEIGRASCRESEYMPDGGVL